jgi:hypothetical protein
MPPTHLPGAEAEGKRESWAADLHEPQPAAQEAVVVIVQVARHA